MLLLLLASGTILNCEISFAILPSFFYPALIWWLLWLQMPLIPFRWLLVYWKKIGKLLKKSALCWTGILHGFSMLSLLMLNIERFLASVYLFYYVLKVSKSRLLVFTILLDIIYVTLILFLFKYNYAL